MYIVCQKDLFMQLEYWYFGLFWIAYLHNKQIVLLKHLYSLVLFVNAVFV